MSPRILAINVLCKSAIDVARGRRIALTSLVQRVIRDATDRQTGDKLAEDWTLVWVTRSRWRASSDLPLYCHDSWSGLHSYLLIKLVPCRTSRRVRVRPGCVLSVRYANAAEDVRRCVASRLEPINVQRTMFVTMLLLFVS